MANQQAKTTQKTNPKADTSEHTAKINILHDGTIISAGTALPAEMSVARRKELLALGAI